MSITKNNVYLNHLALGQYYRSTDLLLPFNHKKKGRAPKHSRISQFWSNKRYVSSMRRLRSNVAMDFDVVMLCSYSDSHADTIVDRRDCTVVHYTEILCDVSAY